MSDMISLKMGVKCAVPLNKGKRSSCVLYMIIYKSSDIELQSI